MVPCQSVALQEASTQTEGGELLGLLSSNLSHVQGPPSSGPGLPGEAFTSSASWITLTTVHWPISPTGGGIQQRNLVGVELDDDKVLLVRGQADGVGRVLGEAAPPRPQPVSR